MIPGLLLFHQRGPDLESKNKGSLFLSKLNLIQFCPRCAGTSATSATREGEAPSSASWAEDQAEPVVQGAYRMAGPSQLSWASSRGLPLSPGHKAAAQLPCIVGNPSRPQAGMGVWRGEGGVWWWGRPQKKTGPRHGIGPEPRQISDKGGLVNSWPWGAGDQCVPG